MFLNEIILETTLPCLAEPDKIRVVGRPSSPLTQVMPYLAALPNVISYNPDACVLTFRRTAGFLTLYENRVTLTQVRDNEEGVEMLSALKDMINATWDNRESLVAATSARRQPKPLDVWAVLPRTNCRQCGETTCMAFVWALMENRRRLVECSPLMTEPALTEHRAMLEAML